MRICSCSKIVVLLAPNSPTVSHTMCYLLYTCFAAQCAICLRHTCFSKIFLCNNICCYLAPLFWHLAIFYFINYFSIWVFNYRVTIIVFKLVVWANAFFGKLSVEFQTGSCRCLFTHSWCLNFYCFEFWFSSYSLEVKIFMPLLKCYTIKATFF